MEIFPINVFIKVFIVYVTVGKYSLKKLIFFPPSRPVLKCKTRAFKSPGITARGGFFTLGFFIYQHQHFCMFYDFIFVGLVGYNILKQKLYCKLCTFIFLFLLLKCLVVCMDHLLVRRL